MGGEHTLRLRRRSRQPATRRPRPFGHPRSRRTAHRSVARGEEDLARIERLLPIYAGAFLSEGRIKRLPRGIIETADVPEPTLPNLQLAWQIALKGRRVPVHPHLSELGFLDRLEERRRRGDRDLSLTSVRATRGIPTETEPMRAFARSARFNSAPKAKLRFSTPSGTILSTSSSATAV